MAENDILAGIETRRHLASDLLGPLNEFEAKNAPAELYSAGDVALLTAGPKVSIVGARKASSLAIQRAKRLAKLLVAEKVTVVSGLAEGIDTASHSAAIKEGGRSIGVLGCPLGVLFGQADRELRLTMMREHLVLSQFAPGHPVLKSNFPRRNRTMALISHATVIVEASDTSGSLSQGWEALRLGRPLFLMRSVVDDQKLKWPAEMLRYGADILGSEDMDRLLDVLPPLLPQAQPEALAF